LQDDDTAFVGSRLLGSQVQRAVDGLEHRPARAEHDRIDEQVELVDQAGPEQGAGEVGAAVGDDDLISELTLGQIGVWPFGLVERLEKTTFRILVIDWANALRGSAGRRWPSDRENLLPPSFG
jgi:hypothetical protein